MDTFLTKNFDLSNGDESGISFTFIKKLSFLCLQAQDLCSFNNLKIASKIKSFFKDVKEIPDSSPKDKLKFFVEKVFAY